MRCPECDQQQSPTHRFCSNCGAPLHPDGITLESTGPFAIGDGTAVGLGDAGEFDGPVLAVRAGGPPGIAFPIPRTGIVSIGRSPESDIFLDDITVSRRHAAVRRVDGGYEVSDVGSLNGTYVDHKRVDTAPLHHLADLQIGRFVLVFLVGSAQ